MPSRAEALDFSWIFIKMGLVLGVLCVAAYVILHYIVPRLGVAKQQHKHSAIEILNRQALGPKTHLWVVRVGARHLLLGTAEQAISCLAELDAKDVATGEIDVND